MARNYESEAVEKFLLPHQPDEGNYTSRVAYETAHKAYRHDCTCVMAAREEWKQHERIEDTCCKAEAARVGAVGNKEHREAAEWGKKCPHVPGGGEEVEMTCWGGQ